MFALKLAAGTLVVAIILLNVYMEVRLRHRKRKRSMLVEAMIGAVLIPIGLGCTLAFLMLLLGTSHPFSVFPAILAIFFALPVFLVAGLIVARMFRNRDGGTV